MRININKIEWRTKILTKRRNEQAVKFECEQWVGKISKKLLQQCSELDRIVLGEINRRGITINGIRKILKSPDVAILPEDTLDREVW
jgi:hypothetical protein